MSGRWICETCNQRFDREKSGNRPIRFCSTKCYQDWRRANNITSGCFNAGHRPWNKDVKGIHLSPKSEWKKGVESERKVSVGTVTIRLRKRERSPRAFVKIAQPNVWRERAIVVWEREHGPLPLGMVVHHRDRNTLNDSIGNLQALTRREHALEHYDELRAFRQGQLFTEQAA